MNMECEQPSEAILVLFCRSGSVVSMILNVTNVFTKLSKP